MSTHAGPIHGMAPSPAATKVNDKLNYVRSKSRWALTTAALALSACPTARGFSPPAPMYNRPTGRPSSSRRFAVTDPDVLLRDVRLRSSIDLDALEKAYMSSADYAEPLFEDFEEQPVLPKRIKKRKKVVPPKPQTRSRSSTMPGFAQQTSRQKAFEDGIKLVESKSGRKFTETAKAKSDRKKQSSKQMYKTSASVPDSLVRFASEIHLVSIITVVGFWHVSKQYLVVLCTHILPCRITILGGPHYCKGGKGTWSKDTRSYSYHESQRTVGRKANA